MTDRAGWIKVLPSLSVRDSGSSQVKARGLPCRTETKLSSLGLCLIPTWLPASSSSLPTGFPWNYSVSHFPVKPQPKLCFWGIQTEAVITECNHWVPSHSSGLITANNGTLPNCFLCITKYMMILLNENGIIWYKLFALSFSLKYFIDYVPW